MSLPSPHLLLCCYCRYYYCYYYYYYYCVGTRDSRNGSCTCIDPIFGANTNVSFKPPKKVTPAPLRPYTPSTSVYTIPLDFCVYCSLACCVLSLLMCTLYDTIAECFPSLPYVIYLPQTNISLSLTPLPPPYVACLGDMVSMDYLIGYMTEFGWHDEG